MRGQQVEGRGTEAAGGDGDSPFTAQSEAW